MCPFKINGQTFVWTFAFMTLVDKCLQSPGHIPVSICIRVLIKVVWFSFSTSSPCFFSQIKCYPSPSWVPLLCLPPAVVAHPVKRDGCGGENVHCTENVRPLLRLGKQSLHWVVVCLAVLLCQKSPCLVFWICMSNLLPLLQAEI